MTEHERIEFDLLFVGGGPANLAGAIRLMQLARENDMELEVALIEKGAEIGSHAVSGAILNPRALAELIPDYVEQGCPIEAEVRGDGFYYLTPTGRFQMPWVPRYLRNEGFYVVSLSRFTRWLAEIAEEMGVNIFPGFTGKQVLYSEHRQSVIGVRSGDKGLDRDGTPKANFEPGMDLLANITVFGEGARGSLMKEIEGTLDIQGRMGQVYETGIKEVIQVPAENNYFAGSRENDLHLMGYPLGLNTPGGGFIYEMADNRIALGFLVGLGYENPLLDPYEEFIKFKQHPFVAQIIQGGKVVEQGARTVSVGGYYSIPRLAVSGAMFVGGGAAMQNPPALKGIHLSMKSGILAAETAIAALKADRFDAATLSDYPSRFERSWAGAEIYEGRNFAAALSKKVPSKLIHLGAQYFSGGRGIQEQMALFPDYQSLVPAKNVRAPESPGKDSFDGALYVDKLTGLYLSKTLHREDQPCHIIVHDRQVCVSRCYPRYQSPCTRFCPGQVYEMERDAAGDLRLKLNPSNCLHCKTCDIKDPYQNITWTCPEGEEGPGYTQV